MKYLSGRVSSNDSAINFVLDHYFWKMERLMATVCHQRWLG